MTVFFQDIKNIDFPILRYLYLSYNQIETIEGISRVNLPALEEIYLSKYDNTEGFNKINKINSIRKTHMPILHQVLIRKSLFIKMQIRF